MQCCKEAVEVSVEGTDAPSGYSLQASLVINGKPVYRSEATSDIKEHFLVYHKTIMRWIVIDSGKLEFGTSDFEFVDSKVNGIAVANNGYLIISVF